MRISMVLLAAAMVAAGPPATVRSESVEVPDCLVTLIDEAQVPARESGQLIELSVREGQYVEQERQVGQIDDLRARMQLQAAEAEYKVAQEESRNTIHIDYAKAAWKVAVAERDAGEWANSRVPGTVPEIEMKRRRLKVTETDLAIKQAQTNLHIAGLRLGVRDAEVKAAREAVERHKLRSPLDGVVVEIYCNQGEWVQTTTDPVVMHIIGLEKLRVEGFLNIENVFPNEIDLRKPVKVDVEVAGGRWVSVPGKIVFVSDLPQPGGDYQVWAEIENPRQNGRWLLRPSLDAKMTIQLK